MIDGKYKIRTWDDMEEEYGSSCRSINIPAGFPYVMNEEMPIDRIVYVKNNAWKGWEISDDMIEYKVDFPCIKIHRYPNIMVLFYSEYTGRVIHSPVYAAGTYSDNWAYDFFEYPTKEEYKKYKHHIKEKDDDKKGEYQMKYKAIKKITGHEIFKQNPCSTEFNNFVKKYGFYDEVEWTKENEDFIIDQNEWIEWLLNNEFIEKVYSFKFYASKVYIYVDEGIDYFLIKQNDFYVWKNMSNTVTVFNEYKDVYDAFKKAKNFWECDSIKEYYKGEGKRISFK